MSAGERTVHPEGSADALQASARGWHSLQLAVLGFIGLCGVLQGDSSGDNPEWLRNTAAVLVVGALLLACLAIILVGTVAWPTSADAPGETELARRSRRLRAGIGLTFVAVAALAAGATSDWWPEQESPSPSVQLSTRAGELCGDLLDGESGVVALGVAGRTVVVPIEQVTTLRAVASCD